MRLGFWGGPRGGPAWGGEAPAPGVGSRLESLVQGLAPLGLGPSVPFPPLGTQINSISPASLEHWLALQELCLLTSGLVRRGALAPYWVASEALGGVLRCSSDAPLSPERPVVRGAGAQRCCPGVRGFRAGFRRTSPFWFLLGGTNGHEWPLCLPLQACERDVQCGAGTCCAISLWLRGLRMCTPLGREGEECHPGSHKVLHRPAQGPEPTRRHLYSFGPYAPCSRPLTGSSQPGGHRRAENRSNRRCASPLPWAPCGSGVLPAP